MENTGTQKGQDMGRYIEATYEGHTYRIPEMWMAGFMQSNPGITIPEVLAWWHQQEMWAARERAEREAEAA